MSLRASLTFQEAEALFNTEMTKQRGTVLEQYTAVLVHSSDISYFIITGFHCQRGSYRRMGCLILKAGAFF